MAVAATSPHGYVVATGTGESESMSLRPGVDFVLSFSSSGAFVLDLQIGPEWADAYDTSGNKVAIDSASGEQQVRVSGGQQYRMSVDTFNNDITMIAREAG